MLDPFLVRLRQSLTTTRHLHTHSTGQLALPLLLTMLSCMASPQEGTYRGPDHCVPPGGGGPTTGGPIGGPQVNESKLVGWANWWNHQQVAYLTDRSAYRTNACNLGGDWLLGSNDDPEQTNEPRRPTSTAIEDKVVPALIQTLGECSDKELARRCLIALAQIGGTYSIRGDIQFAIGPWVRDADQEVSETAVLALGLLANRRSLFPLLRMASGDAPANSILGRQSVPLRTRIHATYALGLMGRSFEFGEDRNQVARQFARTLRTRNPANSELQTAAALSMAMVPVSVRGSKKGESIPGESMQTLQEQVAFLIGLMGDENRPQSPHPAAPQLPTAIARLVHWAEPSLVDQAIIKLTAGIHPDSQYGQRVQESCVMALGEVTGLSSDHAPARSALLKVCVNSDAQAGRLAMISLAKIAAHELDPNDPKQEKVRKALVDGLIKTLQSGGEEEATWASLALALHGKLRARTHKDYVDLNALAAIRKRAKACRSNEHLGGYFIALGLIGDLDSGPFIEDRTKEVRDKSLHGQAMVALAFLDHPGAQDIGLPLLNSKRLSRLTRSQVALSLGRIGDVETSKEISKILGDWRDPTIQHALACALGQISDGGPIDSLIATLTNQENNMASRTGAATALGFICAKEIIPWMNAPFEGANYRALTTSLTGQPLHVFVD